MAVVRTARGPYAESLSAIASMVCATCWETWEWTQNQWYDPLEKVSPNVATLKRYASDRVIRGGGWGDNARALLAEPRLKKDLSYRGNDLGFRLAR